MKRNKPQLATQAPIVPAASVERSILLIRGLKVLLDADLAELYGVSTKRLNEQVKRNKDRFPSDFTFKLTAEEKREVVANCDHLQKLKFSPALPYAFTEHGAIMAATVLNSDRAIKVSLYVVRAFLKLREMLGTQKEFARKLEELEQKFAEHDVKFRLVFRAIRQLMRPTPVPLKRRIGFSAADQGH
jgi:ORF6N domain-containing protein